MVDPGISVYEQPKPSLQNLPGDLVVQLGTVPVETREHEFARDAVAGVAVALLLSRLGNRERGRQHHGQHAGQERYRFLRHRRTGAVFGLVIKIHTVNEGITPEGACQRRRQPIYDM